MVLDDEHKAVAELELYQQAGGSALIEVTTPEFGRDPLALRRIAERSGIHIVSTTGHVSADYWHDVIDVDEYDEEELVAEMLVDLTTGTAGTEIRAGIIKAGSSLGTVLPGEERVLRAAGRVQQETGAPVTTHTSAGTMAPTQARLLVEGGADPRKVCLGHLDRRLDFDTHRALAEEGFILGYDCVSKDWYEPDARRVEHIARLFEVGLGEHICLSGDLARRSQLVAWGGGPGYTYIPWRLVPWLRRVGLGEADVRTLLVDNPTRLLTWHAVC